MAWKEPPTKRSYACNADVLTYLREQRGWTQKQLAEMAGYSERLVSKAEAGQPISAATVADLAESLTTPDREVHPEDLICDPIQMAKDYIAAIYEHRENAVDAIEHFLDENVVFRMAGDPEQIPFAGVHRGIEAMRRAVQIFFSVIQVPEGHDHTPWYSFQGQGNTAIMWGKSWMHPIGQPLDEPITNVSRFVARRGKLALYEDIYDTQAGYEALQEGKQLNLDAPEW